MRKFFLFILPFLFLTIISCGVKDLVTFDSGSISFQISQNVTSQLARNIFADTTTTEKNVDITVSITGDFEAEQSQKIDLANNKDAISFTFSDIPGGSVVNIDAVITRSSDNVVMYEGSQEKVKVIAGTATPVSLKLKAVGPVDELIPTIEILLGEKAEVQSALSMIEIVGEYFIPSDTKAEKYNYYSNLQEDTVEVKELKFTVTNWDAAYKVTLNDVELKVDAKNAIATADVLAAAKNGENIVKVTKDETTTDAGKFTVAYGVYDAPKPVLMVSEANSYKIITDGMKNVRFGIDGTQALGTVMFLALKDSPTTVVADEDVDTILYSDKVKIEYEFSCEGEKSEIIGLPEESVAAAGNDRLLLNTKGAVFPMGAKKNLVLSAKIVVPEEYAEKTADGKAVEIKSSVSFVTSYDVTSKGYVYFKSEVARRSELIRENKIEIKPHLFYIDESNVNESLALFKKDEKEGGSWAAQKSLPSYCGTALDYTFDYKGDLWYLDNPEDSDEYSIIEMVGPGKQGRVIPLHQNYDYLACDYDNEIFYIAKRFLKSNSALELYAFEFSELQNGKELDFSSEKMCLIPAFETETVISSITVKDDYLYIGGTVDSSYIAAYPVIYKYNLNSKERTKELVKVVDEDIWDAVEFYLSDNVELTDLQICDGKLYAIIRQLTGSSDIVHTRGAILEFDLDLNNLKFTGWSEGSEVTSKVRVKGNMSNGEYYLNFYSETGIDYYPNPDDKTKIEPLYCYYDFYFKSPSSLDSLEFFGPERFSAIKPKKLVIADDGRFVYAEEGDGNLSYKRTTSFVTVDLESFAVTKRSKIAPTTAYGGQENIDLVNLNQLIGKTAIYWEACASGDIPHVFEIWDKNLGASGSIYLFDKTDEE